MDKEVDLVTCSSKSYEDFCAEFPGLCDDPRITSEVIRRASQEIYAVLGELPLTFQEARSFLSMIQHELQSFYIGRHVSQGYPLRVIRESTEAGTPG